jgi:hypothetical protein
MRLAIAKLALALGLGLLLSAPAAAAPTAEQRAEILALGTLLTKAGNQYKESKFKDSGETIKEVQTRLEKLFDAADQQTLAQLEPLHKRLTQAHSLLEVEGITLPKLKALPDKATAKPAAKPGAKGAEKNSSTSVSFARDVAPILNSRCGGCHVRNARGRFSMATYEALMKGPAMSGKVIFPSDVKGSVLIEKIQDKEMPPNGMGIPDGELAMLKKWIEDGAKFDGKDPAAQITTLFVATNQPATAPAITVQKATGKETVSFAKDIAPLLSANCLGCHGTQNPRNNLSVNTMASLLKGGDRGEPILPGKPADSLLIKKLKGTADGARMPMGARAFDTATIAKIEKWIEEGAKFDGPDAGQPIEEVSALVIAMSQTHEELSAARGKLAEENWHLGMPNTKANRAESTNFFVLGNVGETTLADVAKRAESLAPKVADTFRAPKDQPLVKGRMTLFVFGERYDYSEFGKMVEKRDIPTQWRGHFRYSIVDAYGAVLAPRAGDYSLDALIAQQLGAVYAAAQGRGVPRWFAEGCGRIVATRMATGADSRIGRWEDELNGALASMAAPDDFLTGKLPPEQADICSFSFVKFLMSDTRRFQSLLDGLRKGGEFTKSFSETYGGSPAQVAKIWITKPPKATPVRKVSKN